MAKSKSTFRLSVKNQKSSSALFTIFWEQTKFDPRFESMLKSGFVLNKLKKNISCKPRTTIVMYV